VRPFYIRERVVEACLVRLSRLRGWLCAKFVSPGLRGMPDRIVLKGMDEAVKYIGLMFPHLTPSQRQVVVWNVLDYCIKFVELKAPGEKPTAQQLRRHAELRALGFEVAVLDSKDAVEVWVDNA
jgi:hypothetical protein